MRIVGGQFRSRELRAPRGNQTRPTTDRVREALFSMLASRHDFTGLRVLDLFAGTGALGLEALSRGAASAVFVEHDRQALRALEHNVSTLGVAERTRIVAAPVERARLTEGFDLVFADPPYELVHDGRFAAVIAGFLAQPARWVVEHASRDAAPELPEMQLISTRVYGDTAIGLYEPAIGYTGRLSNE